MRERFPLVVAAERGMEGPPRERIVEAEVVDAEVLEDRAPPPVPVGFRLSADETPAAPSPFHRPDFLSWRSSLAASAAGSTSRRHLWSRLLGFLAAAVLFIALVALAVLVAL